MSHSVDDGKKVHSTQTTSLRNVEVGTIQDERLELEQTFGYEQAMPRVSDEVNIQLTRRTNRS